MGPFVARRRGGYGRLSALCGLVTLVACRGQAAWRPAGVEGRAASNTPNGEPASDAPARAALEPHSPDRLPPPPPDASNRFADDARAALFGRRLFFDPRLSGKLLDGDNDGSEH